MIGMQWHDTGKEPDGPDEPDKNALPGDIADLDRALATLQGDLEYAAVMFTNLAGRIGQTRFTISSLKGPCP